MLSIVPKLLRNPNAIELIKELLKIYPNEGIWIWLSANPSIFVEDFHRMKEENKPFAEDLAKNTLHPNKIKDLVFRRGMEFDDAVAQENYNKYRLPQGEEIQIVDNKPRFASYEVLKK
jgi:hypothetical protein